MIAFITVPMSVYVFFLAPELVRILASMGCRNFTDKSIIITIFFRLSFTVANQILKSTGDVYIIAVLQGVLAILILCSSWFASTFGDIYEVSFIAAICNIFSFFHFTTKGQKSWDFLIRI